MKNAMAMLMEIIGMCTDAREPLEIVSIKVLKSIYDRYQIKFDEKRRGNVSLSFMDEDGYLYSVTLACTPELLAAIFRLRSTDQFNFQYDFRPWRRNTATNERILHIHPLHDTGVGAALLCCDYMDRRDCEDDFADCLADTEQSVLDWERSQNMAWASLVPTKPAQAWFDL